MYYIVQVWKITVFLRKVVVHCTLQHLCWLILNTFFPRKIIFAFSNSLYIIPLKIYNLSHFSNVLFSVIEYSDDGQQRKSHEETHDYNLRLHVSYIFTEIFFYWFILIYKFLLERKYFKKLINKHWIWKNTFISIFHQKIYDTPST